MRTLLFISFLLCSVQVIAFNKDSAQIVSVLNGQVQGWNSGDIDSYMKGYWNSDSLVFIGKSGSTYGYKATLLRYKKTYSDTAKMGKLGFSDIHIQKLSSTYFFVTGAWQLQRSIGDISGYFTLLFKKVHNKWVIVCDHSS